MICAICRQRPVPISGRSERCAGCRSARKSGKNHSPYEDGRLLAITRAQRLATQRERETR